MLETKSFSEAFDTLKKFTYAMLAVLLIVVIAAIASIIYAFKLSENRVVVVAPDKTMIAYTKYDHETSLAEMRNHIKSFIAHMFSYDQYSFKDNVEQALHLCEKEDGLSIYNSFKQNNLYEVLIKSDARVKVNIDRIEVNTHTWPYSGKFYATQTFENASGQTQQGIAAKFEINTVSRTDENPFGLLLSKIVFLKHESNSSQKEEAEKLQENTSLAQ